LANLFPSTGKEFRPHDNAVNPSSRLGYINSCLKRATHSNLIYLLSRRRSQNPPPNREIVFVGSSTSRYWHETARDFPGFYHYQRGFGGSELTDSLYYVHRIVTPYEPRQVVLYAGDNDIGAGTPPILVARDFRRFTHEVHTVLPNTLVTFLSIKQACCEIISLRISSKQRAHRAVYKADSGYFYNRRFSPDSQRTGQDSTATLHTRWTASQPQRLSSLASIMIQSCWIERLLSILLVNHILLS